MKKTLVAIAALAAVSAFAQSTVTLSGVIAYGYQSSPTKDRGLTNTDMGFTMSAVEDLGGGLAAYANATYDTTGSTFGSTVLRRNSAIGLRGGFGTMNLGNTRSSDLMTRAWVAPASLPDGIYDTSGILLRAPIDVISYTSPNFSGFTGTVAFVESAADGSITPAVKTAVLQLDYSNGPLAIGGAFKASSGAAFVAGIQKSNLELAATYDLGVARLGFGFDGKRAGLASAGSKSALALGVAVPIGAATVGLNYAKRGTAKAYELVGQYSLSKRTLVNLSIGDQSADANGQYRIKLQHSF